MQRHYSALDKILLQFDAGLNTVFGRYQATRDNPAKYLVKNKLLPQDAKLSAGLMRVNHSGEVC
ncbi:MAG TPA: demethoxyubiquinone hydroxylase family protein, partial [Coxiellaceae bacterium]|nr:demethoxyubiquinone hydroxylase family protein [Coxiellaceae bacterium]